VSFTIGQITRLEVLVLLIRSWKTTWDVADGHPIPAGGIEKGVAASGLLKGVQARPRRTAAASDRPDHRRSEKPS